MHIEKENIEIFDLPRKIAKHPKHSNREYNAFAAASYGHSPKQTLADFLAGRCGMPREVYAGLNLLLQARLIRLQQLQGRILPCELFQDPIPSSLAKLIP